LTGLAPLPKSEIERLEKRLDEIWKRGLMRYGGSFGLESFAIFDEDCIQRVLSLPPSGHFPFFVAHFLLKWPPLPQPT
jgi:hypothetical protein